MISEGPMPCMDSAPSEISEADSFTAPSFPLLSTLSKPPRVPKELLVAFGPLSRAELEVLV